jgi:hypothetical protein
MLQKRIDTVALLKEVYIMKVRIGIRPMVFGRGSTREVPH